MDVVRVHKRFLAPFLVGRTKLTRLHDVVTEKLSEFSPNHEDKFVAILARERAIETPNLTDVFNLDNSERHPIANLRLLCTSPTPAGKTPEHEVRVEFDSERPADISASVHSANQQWALATMAKIEEQLERVLQRDVIPRLLNKRMFWPLTGLVTMMALWLSMFAVVLGTTGSGSSPQISRMWLSDKDLQDFEPLIGQNRILTQEQVAQLLTRQLRNLVDKEKSGSRGPQWSAFRIASLVIPVGLIASSLLYMALTCYPLAVFLWGDREELHRSLVTRRRAIWSLIIVSMGVGVLANLFAYGVVVGAQ